MILELNRKSGQDVLTKPQVHKLKTANVLCDTGGQYEP